MKKTTYLFLLIFISCDHGVEPDDAFAVAGTYQFIQYETSGKSYDNPTGELTVKQLDNQHVSILVKGVAGSTKISYSYPMVLITSPARDQYKLLVKGRTIGEAGSDGVSRYMTITPASSIVIKSMEF